MALTAEQISFRYENGGRQILQKLNLSVAPGERLGIVAPSGRGKTTLCKILAGYERPDEGRVLVDGQPLYSIRGYCPVQMVWQHPELAVDPRMRLGRTLAEADRLEQRVIDGLGIEPAWKRRYPSELSGGELQRFCIARALGQGTRYLLADEISAMLDLITQSQLWNFLLAEIEQRRIGLVVVSHSQTLLNRVCTHIQEI